MHEISKRQEGTFYTVSVSFLNDSSNIEYTYKVPNEHQTKNGDLAIVETNSGYKIVKVKSVHNQPKIDYTVPYEYNWLVGTVPLSDYLGKRKAEQQIKKENKWDF